MTLFTAMEKVCFSIFGDYAFFLYHLDSEEIAEEEIKLMEAWSIINAYEINFVGLLKHWKRQSNKPHDSVRFIDRPHFIAVETNQLPF